MLEIRVILRQNAIFGPKWPKWPEMFEITTNCKKNRGGGDNVSPRNFAKERRGERLFSLGFLSDFRPGARRKRACGAKMLFYFSPPPGGDTGELALARVSLQRIYIYSLK